MLPSSHSWAKLSTTHYSTSGDLIDHLLRKVASASSPSFRTEQNDPTKGVLVTNADTMRGRAIVQDLLERRNKAPMNFIKVKGLVTDPFTDEAQDLADIGCMVLKGRIDAPSKLWLALKDTKSVICVLDINDSVDRDVEKTIRCIREFAGVCRKMKVQDFILCLNDDAVRSSDSHCLELLKKLLYYRFDFVRVIRTPDLCYQDLLQGLSFRTERGEAVLQGKMPENTIIPMVGLKSIVRRTVEAFTHPQLTEAITTVPVSQTMDVTKYLEQVSMITGIRLSYERINDDVPQYSHAVGTILRRAQGDVCNDRKRNGSMLRRKLGSGGKGHQQPYGSNNNNDWSEVSSISCSESEPFKRWAMENKLVVENNIGMESVDSAQAGQRQRREGDRKGRTTTHASHNSLLQQMMQSPVIVDEDWVKKTVRSVFTSRKSLKRKVERHNSTKSLHKMKRISEFSSDYPKTDTAKQGAGTSVKRNNAPNNSQIAPTKGENTAVIPEQSS
eukprot:jgi/Bigna1/139223/aug1.49_g13931